MNGISNIIIISAVVALAGLVFVLFILFINVFVINIIFLRYLSKNNSLLRREISPHLMGKYYLGGVNFELWKKLIDSDDGDYDRVLFKLKRQLRIRLRYIKWLVGGFVLIFSSLFVYLMLKGLK